MSQHLNAIAMPDYAYMHYGQNTWWWQDRDGVVACLSEEQTRQELKKEKHALCVNARNIQRRMKLDDVLLIDLAQLWIFVIPDQAVPENVHDFCVALAIPEPQSSEEECMALPQIVRLLMQKLPVLSDSIPIKRLAAFLSAAQWAFASAVVMNLRMDAQEVSALSEDSQALSVHQNLAKWQDEPFGAGDLGRGISEEEAVKSLAASLPKTPELRPSQVAYTKAVQKMFAPSPPQVPDYADIHLLQAGTGIGKTLGYVSPARIWAERNAEPVWISTYSRHLQDQIMHEATRILSHNEVTIVKGRENYLCLLNFDEMRSATMGLPPDRRIVLGLLARWLMHTREGIMVGGDFPLWLEENAPSEMLRELRLKQGECLYSACPFYQQCFIESNSRRALQAKLVVANHALTLRLAMKTDLPSSRLIIDEAHQLFDASDSATRLRLGLYEIDEVKRWLLGGDTGRRRRVRRGLRKRLEGVELDDETLEELLRLEQHCAIFPNLEGLFERITEGEPATILESFFVLLHQRMHAHNMQKDNPLGFEVELPIGENIDQELLDKACEVHLALGRIVKSTKDFIEQLRDLIKVAKQNGEGGERFQSLIHGIEEYPLYHIQGWLYLFARLTRQDTDAITEDKDKDKDKEKASLSQETDAPSNIIERMYYTPPKANSRRLHLGMEMIYRDPCEILQEWIFSSPQRHVLMTSASLGDDWEYARMRVGVTHLPKIHTRQEVHFPSPFNYPKQAQFIVINDIESQDSKAVYNAMARLICVSRGGALGLFNAIYRAKGCYQKIYPLLDAKNLPLLSQHDDAMGNVALANAMRQDVNTSLIATDAFRDGVDIPGVSLRLVILEKLSWPRPDIIHQHRKKHFGSMYNKHIVRQRLMQSFGRLIRNAEDWGTFVLLDKSLSSDIAESLPVKPERLSLSEAEGRIFAQYQENFEKTTLDT